MIIGIGADIVEIQRIADSISRYGSRFLDKVFAPDERAYCESRPQKNQHYAARFAAKEAFSKAIGSGWQDDFSWKDIWVVSEPNGKPVLRLSGALLAHWGDKRLHISLSHTSEYAYATVIIEE